MKVRSLIGRFSLSLLGFDSHPVSKICCCTSPDAIPLFTHILALGVPVLSQGIKGKVSKASPRTLVDSYRFFPRSAVPQGIKPHANWLLLPLLQTQALS